jgi:futalosine hydrolase
MNILLTAATQNELVQLQQELNVVNNNVIINNNNVQLAVTGVGITITAYRLTRLLLQNNFNLVLNMGIAGSFLQNVGIGNIVVVEEEIFGDWGVHTPNGYRTVFEENIVKNALPFINGDLKCNYISTHPELNKYKKVKSVTVNAASGERTQIEVLHNKFNPDIESMEGAAFFYVCMVENVPFIEIRSISNMVEERNKTKWNIPLAIDNLTKAVKSFLYGLC